MSTLRYTVAVGFDVAAGDAATLEEKMSALESIGDLVSIKAKSAGVKKVKEANAE